MPVTTQFLIDHGVRQNCRAGYLRAFRDKEIPPPPPGYMLAVRGQLMYQDILALHTYGSVCRWDANRRRAGLRQGDPECSGYLRAVPTNTPARATIPLHEDWGG